MPGEGGAGAGAGADEEEEEDEETDLSPMSAAVLPWLAVQAEGTASVLRPQDFFACVAPVMASGSTKVPAPIAPPTAPAAVAHPTPHPPHPRSPPSRSQWST